MYMLVQNWTHRWHSEKQNGSASGALPQFCNPLFTLRIPGSATGVRVPEIRVFSACILTKTGTDHVTLPCRQQCNHEITWITLSVIRLQHLIVTTAEINAVHLLAAPTLPNVFGVLLLLLGCIAVMASNSDLLLHGVAWSVNLCVCVSVCWSRL